MCSGLNCDETSRYLSKCLFYRFRCRRHFLFQNDLSCFIQNTVERPAISQIHTDRQLLLLENFVTKYLHSANLLHSRSPFCALSTSFIGSVSHPAGDRPSHPICLVGKLYMWQPGFRRSSVRCGSDDSGRVVGKPYLIGKGRVARQPGAIATTSHY